MHLLEKQLEPYTEKLRNSQSAPMKTYPALVEIKTNGNCNNVQQETVGIIRNNGDSSPSTYWSWTFGLTTFPFFFWGCPFYLLTSTPYQVTSTFSWIKRIFDFCSFPFTTLLSILLLIPTVSLNAYIIYAVGDMFVALFITGVFRERFFDELIQVIRYIPLIVPLDYIWFRGYRVSNMIRLLNYLYGKYGGIGCGIVRIKLFAMIFIIFSTHVVRYIVYERYELTKEETIWGVFENAFQFSLDIYLSYLLPLYCTFCYCIQFQFHIIQAFLYKLIRERIRPNISHLNRVKTLFTQASDNIMTTNSFFSLYLSVAFLLLIIGTVVDAGSMWTAIMKFVGGGPLAGIIAMIAAIGKDMGLDEGESQSGSSNSTNSSNLTPAEIREINLEIACVVITYALICYTVWQAIGTNDIVREIHVWLNDFVTGGGGTDVLGVLENLGISKKSLKSKSGNDEADDDDDEQVVDEGRTDFFLEDLPLVWARSSLLESTGMTDEFLKKFMHLKAFIHVRMQTEKPALLNISLLVLLAPPLSSRLRRYRLVF